MMDIQKRGRSEKVNDNLNFRDGSDDKRNKRRNKSIVRPHARTEVSFHQQRRRAKPRLNTKLMKRE